MIYRYIIFEYVAYESKMSWTIQAESLDEAKAFIKKERDYTGEILTVESRRLIKGSTQKGIIKRAKRHYDI